jgi:hypothetical protein
MTRFETTEHNVTCAYVIYMWTLILLQNTFCHEWSRFVTLCIELLYIISFDLHNQSMIFLMQQNIISQFLTLHLDSIFTAEHVLTRMVRTRNEFLYIISFDD